MNAPTVSPLQLNTHIEMFQYTDWGDFYYIYYTHFYIYVITTTTQVINHYFESDLWLIYDTGQTDPLTQENGSVNALL